MAVDVYSENFAGMISPRLSFSRDLEENETNTNLIHDFSCKLDHSPADSAFDFAFNVDSNVASHSSADELFSNGKILPSSVKKEEIKTREILQQKSVTLTPCLDLPPTSETKKKSLREFLEDSIEEEESNNNFGTAKSFWKFRRSNSLNCDRNQRKGFIGSWKILSRSGSTGKFLEKILENEEEKPRNSHSKNFWKFSNKNSLNSEKITGIIGSSKILRRSHSTSDHYLTKPDSKPFRRSNSTGSAPNTNTNKLKKQQSLKQQKHEFDGNTKSCPKRKVKDNCKSNYNYSYENHYKNLRMNPVLNLPSPYISRVSVDLFSFGSLFCNGAKDRKKNK
ncbi:unnamed protein product [Amaranthus hypochondriacus]